MTESTQASLTPEAVGNTAPVSSNLAVVRCCEAYACAYKAARKRGKGDIFASLYAEKAFRAAMPSLSGSENIRDFIACVAHGMLIEAIAGSNGARLLYAAQVAHSTIRTQSPPPKSRFQ
jgi:hypothetical protein